MPLGVVQALCLVIWALLGRAIVDLLACGFAEACLGAATTATGAVAAAGASRAIIWEESRSGHGARRRRRGRSHSITPAACRRRAKATVHCGDSAPDFLGQPVSASSAPSAACDVGAPWTEFGRAINSSPQPLCLSTSRTRGVAARRRPTGSYTRGALRRIGCASSAQC